VNDNIVNVDTGGTHW